MSASHLSPGIEHAWHLPMENASTTRPTLNSIMCADTVFTRYSIDVITQRSAAREKGLQKMGGGGGLSQASPVDMIVKIDTLAYTQTSFSKPWYMAHVDHNSLSSPNT